MSIFKFLYLVVITFIFLGCVDSAKPTALESELKPYDSTQKGCGEFFKDEDEKITALKKECQDFMLVLKQTNEALLVKKSYKNDPRYFRSLNDYKAAKHKLSSQYKHLTLVFKSKAFDAIDSDDKELFSKIVNFPSQKMNIYYYNYMNKNRDLFSKNREFKQFKLSYAQKKYKLGYKLVNKGKFTQGLAALSVSTQMGNVKAASLCGNVYYDLYPKKSLNCYLQAVTLGDESKQLNVAKVYEEQGNDKKALLWYEKSAYAGNFIAQYKMYEFYKNARAVLIDSQKAQEWLKKSADSGYAKAQFTYGNFLISKKKESLAVVYLTKAVNAGEEDAYYPLGKLYFKHKEYKKAYQTLSKAEINSDSMYMLGYLKENAKGTSRSYYSAYAFYKKSQSLGKKSAKKDVYRMSKAKKRLKSRARKQEQKNLIENESLIKEKRQKRHLAKIEDERLKQQRKTKKSEALKLKITACGYEASDSRLRREGEKVHLEGQVTQWLNKKAFILKTDENEFYIKDEADEAKVNRGDRVSVIAYTTGKRELVHGLRRSLFEEPDSSSIVKAYALNFSGVCPY